MVKYVTKKSKTPLLPAVSCENMSRALPSGEIKNFPLKAPIKWCEPIFIETVTWQLQLENLMFFQEHLLTLPSVKSL